MIHLEQAKMRLPNNASKKKASKRADATRLLRNLLIVGAATYVSARIALVFRVPPYHIAPLWPPSAILVAVLLSVPVRRWPAYTLVWWISNIIVHVSIGEAPRTMLIFIVANTIEVFIAVFCVRRWAGGLQAFSNLQCLAAYILFAVVLAPLISAFVGALDRSVANYWFDWRVWFFGDVISYLTLAPALVTWITRTRIDLKAVSLTRWIEAGLVGCGLLAISVFVFIKPASGQDTSPALLYLPLPALLWAAVRFGPTGLQTSLLLVALLSIFGAVEGHGPFVTTTLVDNVLSLQLFLITISLPLMFLAVLVEERRKSTNVLRESEASITLAANAAHLGLWHWDIRDNKLWGTEKWRELFGFTESEPVNFDRLLQVVHSEDRERMKQLVQSVFEHGGENESEYRIKLPDGSTRWITGYGRVELDEVGKPAFARGVSRDITLRKHAEEELRESEARFRVVADAAPVLIWMSGPDKLCTFFNKGWLDFTGRTLDEELGNGWAEGVHAEDLDRCVDIYENSFDARQPFTMEYHLRRRDGEYRWVLDIGTPRFAADGEFLGYIGSCIDITERKRAEEKFRLVLDAAPNAMIMVDASGVITFVSASAADVFGYSLNELIGSKIETLVPERFGHRHAGYRKDFVSEPSTRAMGAGRDLFGLRKDGSQFPVEVGLSPIRTEEGLFVLASVIDITARKQADLEHQRQNLELARVGRVAVMGELAASLAHEVNNPIGAIVANASAGQRLLAAGKIEAKELDELLADIVADGHRAGEVIQGIRNMVRKGEARRGLIQIGEIIDQLLRVVHADAIEREVKITPAVDPDAGQVWGDPVQLLQVFLNLAINAFEAMSSMPSNARRLVIHAGRNKSGYILVSFRDSGPGFPSGMAQELFEPFFSTKAEGTGMGLAIAYSIIEAHDGTLSAENCEDGGACFTIRLPQAKEDTSQAG